MRAHTRSSWIWRSHGWWPPTVTPALARMSRKASAVRRGARVDSSLWVALAIVYSPLPRTKSRRRGAGSFAPENIHAKPRAIVALVNAAPGGTPPSDGAAGSPGAVLPFDGAALPFDGAGS